jgi:hypothetical protein
MVRLKSFSVAGPSTVSAANELSNALQQTDLKPDFIFAFYDAIHEDAIIFDAIREHFPHAPILGGTSCAGVMTEAGLGGPGSIGLLLIEDPEGNYGSAAVGLGPDASAAAELALRQALDAADCPGELPEIVWIYQAPGREEAVIEGLRRIVGDRCPIVGGSSADNEVAGNWRQLGPDGPIADGLVVGVLFSSGGIGFAFQGGYEPTGPSGVVTRVGFDPAGGNGVVTQTRGRHIISIDHMPAAETYSRWVGDAFAGKLAAGGNILAETTLCPLGINTGNIDGVSHYLLVHPDAITPVRGLSTFATIEEGTRIYSMRGDRRRLVERAGRVAATAAATLPEGPGGLAGGIIVYCGGCMLAVGDDMPKVSEAVATSFSGTPFVGCFTFGEQGLILGKNVHGNLMISAITFGR